MEGENSHQNMEGLLRDIFNFHTEYEEQVHFKSYNGEYEYHVVRVPVAKDAKDFQDKAKSTKWIKSILEHACGTAASALPFSA